MTFFFAVRDYPSFTHFVITLLRSIAYAITQVKLMVIKFVQADRLTLGRFSCYQMENELCEEKIQVTFI